MFGPLVLKIKCFAMGVGKTFQIFNFFNIHTKDFQILHNKERQKIDVLLLFLKKFLFGSMAI